MARTEEHSGAELRIASLDDATRLIAPGDRIVFFQLRGEGETERGAFVSWGEVERLNAAGDAGAATLRNVAPLKRRVAFTELRSDPRRGRTGAVQEISAEVFNLVLARSRR